MKKLMFILLLFPLLTMGQKKLDRFVDRQIKSGVDSIRLQISVTNYCINQYRKEKMMGYTAQLVGLGAVFFGVNDKINGVTDAVDEVDLQIARYNNGKGRGSLNEVRNAQQDLIDISERNQNILTAGSVIAIGGTVMNVIAHRWLKKSYILPAEHGIGVMIKF